MMKNLLQFIFFVSLLLSISSTITALPVAKHFITAKQFGAIPDDGKNDADALRAAAAYCRNHSETELTIAPGIYDFADNDAIKIEREAVSGAYGRSSMDVQNRLFVPKGPYIKGLDFNGAHNLTIKANGATLRMQGWYEVISLVNAHHVTIEGLAITYKRWPSTVGRIVASDDVSFEMAIDTAKCYYLDSIVTGRVHFFDAKRELIYFRGVKSMELVNPTTIRMMLNVNKSSNSTQIKPYPAIGDYCILRHGGHYRPAIMIKESTSVLLKDVKIFSHPGMGVVGHLSKDITLDDLQVVPEPGNVISTNTDATHFTSCSGELVIKNCKFRGNGDDCTNIHNYYYCFYPESPTKVEIRIEDADLHALSLDYPQIGDTMLVLNRKNMQEQGQYVVQKVDTSYAQWKVSVTLNKPFNGDAKDYYMTNITRFPNVTIVNNNVNCHMGRGFLVKSKNVYIARNSIYNTTHTGIKLGAELSWHESGPAENVVIEDNYISGCGYAVAESEAAAVYTSTESPETPPCVNRKIIIRRNTIATDKPFAIVLKDAQNVSILNNKVSHKDYVHEENCKDINIIE